jgi:dTDP-glucose 4,6-dehydratase
MSTDEVYGSIAEGMFTEESNYAPSSPYAASKAAGDHMVRAYRMTHGLPVIIVHASNTYGPRQYPEKLIPHIILSALNGCPLPVYGAGANVRDWLHVKDLAAGLEQVVVRGAPGEIYNFAAGDELCNIDTVKMICARLGSLKPTTPGYESRITFVKDRPGHDLRYAMSREKAERVFGWRPRTGFNAGLSSTVAWYVENDAWCRSVLDRGYDGARIGTRAER